VKRHRAQVLATVIVAVAVGVPWAWFTARTWIFDPLGQGTYETWLAGVSAARLAQGLVYLAASGGLAALFAAVAMARIRVAGTWRFRSYSVGRVSKWALAGVPFGYVLALIPPAALFADTEVNAPPLEPFPWIVVGWVLILLLSTLAHLVLFVVDVSGLRNQASGSTSVGENGL
jgi:hypothetical protein